MTHLSDSSPQREAETLIREELARTLDTSLKAQVMALGEGASVQVDGVSPDESVLVEIFAHQGILKGGQKHKVKGDALKLITLARTRPSSQLVLAFGSEEAARYALQTSWVAEALRIWGIKVFVVELQSETQDGLRAAQVRQVMVNHDPASQ
jgi:hypothetical protein